MSAHGNPKLCDGPHQSIEGCEKSLYIYRRLGLAGVGYAACRVEIHEVEPNPHGADETALTQLNSIGLK